MDIEREAYGGCIADIRKMDTGDFYSINEIHKALACLDKIC
jgi:hypothetical protein